MNDGKLHLIPYEDFPRALCGQPLVNQVEKRLMGFIEQRSKWDRIYRRMPEELCRDCAAARMREIEAVAATGVIQA